MVNGFSDSLIALPTGRTTPQHGGPDLTLIDANGRLMDFSKYRGDAPQLFLATLDPGTHRLSVLVEKDAKNIGITSHSERFVRPRPARKTESLGYRLFNEHIVLVRSAQQPGIQCRRLGPPAQSRGW
jgi:hypothetical protein